MTLDAGKVILILVVVIDLILKGYGLWKAAQAKQKGWFIAMLVLNTAGILPGIYLLLFAPDAKKKK